MNRARTLRLLRFVAIPAVGLSVLAAACGGDSGPSQAEYDQLKAELDDTAAEADQYRVQVGGLQDEADELEGQVGALQTQVAEAPDSGAEGDVTVLLAAGAVEPPPPPTPAPTLAPGVTPTPAPERPTPPPSYYEPVGDFAGYIETLATQRASEYNVAGTISCVGSTLFIRGQRIVFRYELVDLTTGLRLTDQNAESVKVVLENGDESNGRWSQRGGGRVPDAPWMWSATWDIPLDYKLGGIDYHLEITMKDGRTGTWTPPWLVSETSDTRPRVLQ